MSIEAKLLAYAYGEPRSHDASGSRITVNIGFLSRGAEGMDKAAVLVEGSVEGELTPPVVVVLR